MTHFHKGYTAFFIPQVLFCTAHGKYTAGKGLNIPISRKLGGQRSERRNDLNADPVGQVDL